MCGIVVVAPSYADTGVSRSMHELIDALATPVPDDAIGLPPEMGEWLDEFGKRLEDAVELFRSAPALRLLGEPSTDIEQLRARLDALSAWALRVDEHLDAEVDGPAAAAIEGTQARVRRIRDQLFAIEHDGLAAARAARSLTGGPWDEHSAVSYAAIATALDAIDRLEVRGRDSAGIGVWIDLEDADQPVLAGLPALGAREDALLRDGSVVRDERGVCFVYKRAAIVGHLGDNTAHLRSAIRADDTLHTVLALPSARVTVLAHTRWASVGRTSVSNAHPVDNAFPDGSAQGPPSIAVVNGDVDNYVALGEQLGYVPDAAGVTTDAKLIPLLVSAGLGVGRTAPLAVADMLRACAGSMAIAVKSSGTDGEVYLAVKGSGQSLYVGLSGRGYLVASEIYGLVGQTRQFVRIDGTDTGEPGGAVVRLGRAGCGRLTDLQAWTGTGQELSLPRDPQHSDVTSRDLALGSYRHFLDKELHDAPESFRRTLRGRMVAHEGRMQVALPESSLPAAVRARLTAGGITDMVVVGQGTAAVAGHGIAHIVGAVVGNRLRVSALAASEFSAWHLRRDMSDTLLVAVSQSGSTTDTNRTVDLARERGAAVLAIVNRRESDLAHKSHGVIYTSDGRDVELSVASTKAFYSQVAAGSLLGLALGRLLDLLEPGIQTTLVESLTAMPAQLRSLLADVDTVRRVARTVATAHPNWAVIGSGPNRIAADEIRIKLSELCYKTVAVDAVEDKKHIDLSAEALVVVCAAGVPPNQITDLTKEVEILRAHNNPAVVICDADTVHLWASDLVIPIPPANPALAWVLATAAGHLFAYHVAQAIDATAQPLRQAVDALENLVDAGWDVDGTPPAAIGHPVQALLASAASGELRGVLSSAAAIGLVPIIAPSGQLALALDVRQPSGSDVIRAGLETAIEELTRSIDTIKHQAKTVTVGTSRGDSDLYDNVLVDAIRSCGVDVVALSLPVLDVLRSLAPVVHEATGVTRYAINWAEPTAPRVRVVSKSGVAANLASRADREAPLIGSKRRVAELAVPRLIRGRADGRVVVIVPERAGGEVRFLSLVHVDLRPAPGTDALRRAVRAMGDRAEEIIAAITETAPDYPRDAVWTIRPSTLLLDPLGQVVEEALRVPR